MNSIEAQKQHLFALIGDFDVAMLVCEPADGETLVRPVRVVELTAHGEAIVAAWDAPALAAIDQGAHVLLAFQGRNRNRFAWMRGPATVERRRAEIVRRWDDAWLDWFPGGVGDPALCLIVVAGAEGEYWDRRQPGGLSEVLERARTLIVGGGQPESSPPHGKVKLACREPKPPRRRRQKQPSDGIISPPAGSAVDTAVASTEGEAEP